MEKFAELRRRIIVSTFAFPLVGGISDYNESARLNTNQRPPETGATLGEGGTGAEIESAHNHAPARVYKIALRYGEAGVA